MIKRMLRLCVLFLIPALLSGCVYSRVTLPLDTDVNATRLGTKVGRASTQSVMWLVGWGDSGVQAAAKNGELQVVNHLDMESFIVLFGVYSRRTTIAYGD